MTRFFYLGIDESNHGQFPEIFVAVYSKLSNDIEEAKRLMPKIRGGKYHGAQKGVPSVEAVLEILGGRTFKHLVINENYKKFLCKNPNSYGCEFVENVKAVCISELIQSSSRDVEGVFVDGNLDGRCLDKINYLLPDPLKSVQITPEINGDRLRKIVNLADEVAHILFTYYRNTDLLPHVEFASHLIRPDLDKYQKLLVG